MLPTQPLAVGGILDAGIKLFRSTFFCTLGIALVAAIPYAAASGYLSYLTNQLGAVVETGAGLETNVLGPLLVSVPIIYLTLVFAMNGIIHRQLSIVRDEPQSLAADVGTALKLLLPVLVAFLTYTLCAMLGSLLLLVPGLILMISMVLFPLVPQMEDRSGWSGAFRSHQLIWGGNWWRAAVVLTVVGLLGLVFAIVLGLVLGVAIVAGSMVPTEMTWPLTLLEAVVNSLTLALTLPLAMACYIVLYNDCLLRKEGADLDARLGELDSASGS